MTKYDFETIIERKGKDAVAYDCVGKVHWGIEPEAPEDGYDFIPMWVADMCFATAPSVTDALLRRAEEPTFGYFIHSPEYYESIISWQKEQNGVEGLTRDDIGYENGVHGFISSAIEILTQPGDYIFLHRPYYVAFASDILQKGRFPVYSDLVKDEQGIYRMDYEDMDRKLKEKSVEMAIFCSPHNPSGRVWEREELERAMEVFEENGCTVFSDEIWSDLIFSGHRHIPSQQLGQWARNNVIAAYAPSKSFNLAGLIGSYHIIYNKSLRQKIRNYSLKTNYNEMNVLSMHALIGAYSPRGKEWLEELKTVLESNCRYAVNYISSNIKGVKLAMPQGTYMLFLDCTEYCSNSGRSIDDIIHAGWSKGVGWQDGRQFGGAHHIRLNLALPRSLEMEALERMKKYVFI